MKELIVGIVLLLVIGIAGFFYRNALEHPIAATPPATACTEEAKLCPDGTSVGRSGPDCSFAACPLPNAEDAAVHLAFVIPTGYTANADAIGPDESLRAVFEKPAQGSVPNSIIIRDYQIAAGQTATSTILAHTLFEPSGMMATSLSKFTNKTEGENTYLCVTIERFEGVIHTACYLPRTTDVVLFEVVEQDVADWTNTNLNSDALPEHAVFYNMLATVQA